VNSIRSSHHSQPISTVKNIGVVSLNSTSTVSARDDGRANTQSSWRSSLPQKLQSKGPKTLQKICFRNIDIYLLGTAHVSNDSSTDVRLLLNAVHPDCIFVELCDARIPLLEGVERDHTVTSGTDDDSRASTTTTNSSNNGYIKKKHSMLERIREAQESHGGSRLQALSTVLLSRVQEDYAKELGVELGGEFRCAYEYWKNCTKARDADIVKRNRRPHLVLGDRPLHLTLVRAWESLGWWPKIKVVVGLVWSSLRKPNTQEIREWLEAVMREESDVLTESFQELRKNLPTLYTTIIEERDAWLAAKLTQTCFALSRQAAVDKGTGNDNDGRIIVVAIVGAGHVPGICGWLTTARNQTATPEAVLAELVVTKRWAHDSVVQQEAIPSWIHDVSELAHEKDASEVMQ
jgi:pheromone shutdown protein TraB